MKSLDAKLAALRKDPSDSELRDALRSTTGVLVAAAAKLAAERGVLLDELAPAFARLCERADKRDPGCRGKVAIARALHDADRWEEDVFAAGVRVVQREPIWGGTQDTAAELRGICGLAYAHLSPTDALDVLAELLIDPERTARQGAARALGDLGRPDASALLRYKLLAGDEDGEVLAACCESLLHLQKHDAIAFLGRLCARDDERAEVVVLALGASRLEPALAPIVAWCERAMPEPRRRVGYLALALTRLASDRLLDVVGQGEPADAVAAARALATFKDDPAVRASVVAAAKGRREAREIEALF
ncbi:MAG TPA: HEAT repeat domain-containing protein [Kofleriaceae bacterium]|nr:HEAT repeat domain-containing protein [Kofleriaceae bacterium]